MGRIVTYTHHGIFGLCHVLIARHYSDDPDLRPRYPFTAWLFWFTVCMMDAASDAIEAFGGETPGYPIKVIGRLKESVSYIEDDES